MLPSFDDLREVLSEAAERLNKDRTAGFVETLPFIKRKGGVLYTEEGLKEDILVVGDLHGDHDSLVRVLDLSKKADLAIFLGDYIDRGPWDKQIMVIYTLLEKLIHKENIILLRGNHEAPPGLEPAGQDFPVALMELYNENGRELLRLAQRVWNNLPHAMVIKNRVLLVHGGPPTINLDYHLLDYLGAMDDPDQQILEEILWNDPLEADIVRAPNPRGAGSLWGKPVTRIALEKVNGKLIIRGHEPVMTGYKWNHDGMVLTLFTSRIPVYPVQATAVLYCNTEDLSPYADECIKIL